MRGRIAALALAGLAAAGCATPTPAERLPEEPLVFVHRTLAQGRDRAERLANQRGDGRESGGGVLKLNEFDEMVDRFRGEGPTVSPELQGRVALFHPRSGEIEPLSAFVPGSLPCDWSDDHERLLVSARYHGRPRLLEYSMTRRDVAVAVRGTERGSQIAGAYGPDRRIAFADALRAGPRLLVSIWEDVAGGETRRLTAGPADVEPRWSPDGKVLLFESRLRNGDPVIKALDVEDELAEPRVIARGREPRFSPRGGWVVYSRERPEGWRLWRMRPNGTGKTALGHAVQGDADERQPTVSPDGKYVAYMAEEGDRQQIRIRGMDGEGDRLLVEHADGALPIW